MNPLITHQSVVSIHSEQIASSSDILLWQKACPDVLARPLIHGETIWGQRATRKPTDTEKHSGNLPDPPPRHRMKYDSHANEVVFWEVYAKRFPEKLFA